MFAIVPVASPLLASFNTVVFVGADFPCIIITDLSCVSYFPESTKRDKQIHL